MSLLDFDLQLQVKTPFALATQSPRDAVDSALRSGATTKNTYNSTTATLDYFEAHRHLFNKFMSDTGLNEKLTPRESEILSVLTTGVTVKFIARVLGISPHTVNAHLKVIYRKFDVHSKNSLIKKIHNVFIFYT